MSNSDLGDIDSLDRKFLAELDLRPELGASEVTMTDRVEVVFPAKHPEVGDIHVWLDGDEVTVGIGENFHTHFESYLDSSISREEGETQAARDALDFICDFMQGRLLLEVTYRGERPTGATVRAREDKRRVSATVGVGIKDMISRIRRPAQSEKRVYSWDGPVGLRE